MFALSYYSNGNKKHSLRSVVVTSRFIMGMSMCPPESGCHNDTEAPTRRARRTWRHPNGASGRLPRTRSTTVPSLCPVQPSACRGILRRSGRRGRSTAHTVRMSPRGGRRSRREPSSRRAPSASQTSAPSRGRASSPSVP